MEKSNPKKEELSDNNYSLFKSDYFIKKVSLKFIINSVISTLLVFAGSLIDTLIVGAFLGEDGLAAMSLVSPVYLIFYTVGATIGIGGSILASRAIGNSDVDGYRKIFTLSTVILLISVLIMTSIGYIFFNQFADLLCGEVTGIRKEMFKEYLLYYIPGGGCTLMTYIPLYFLKTDGRPKISSRLFSLSAIMNMLLTWLFMNPSLCNMGIGGASLATSISMGTVAVLGFILILRGKTEIKFVRNFFSKNLIKDIIFSGIPNGMNNLLSSARILLINMLLIGIGASAFLPCFTVVRNVTDVLNSIILGLSSAVIPLVGVMFGERDFDGSRTTMKYALRIGVIVMIPLVIIVSFISGPIFKIFAVTDQALIQEGYWAIPLASVGLIAAYVNVLFIGYLTAIKREWFATILVILRLFGLLATFAFPLSAVFGSKGIWASLSLSEIFTLLIFLIISSFIVKRSPSLDVFLLDTTKRNYGDIKFSVRNDINDIVTATKKITLFCEDNDVDMRRSMKISLAIEEILTFLNSHCVDNDKNSFTDIRVVKLEDEVMIRFRYVGKIFDPTEYYHRNEENEEMKEELLGIKMIVKSASLVHFSQLLGANNLMLIF